MDFDGRAKLLIANLKPSIKSESNSKDVFFSKANRVGGNDILVITKNKTTSWCKCFENWYYHLSSFITIFSKQCENYQHFVHFLTTIPFLSLTPRLRPRPCVSCASTNALASRSRWTTPTWPLKAAKCSGVEPREPWHETKPQAEPNGTKGKKTVRKFGHLKSRSFGNSGHSNSP